MSSNALLWPSQGTKPEERLDKYKYLRLPSQGVGGAAQAQVFDSMAYELDDWFSVLWQQRIQLTINGGQVPSTQTDFPLLINDTYPELVLQTEAELRFTGADNVQLDYEIEKFDSGSGELVAWVKKPSVSDGDIIRIYFDNPLAGDEQNPFDVWSDYSNVYHMNNVPATNSILDSTVAQETGDPINTSLVVGKIGDAQDFDETSPSQILLANYDVSFPFSISMWVKPTNSNSGSLISVTDAVLDNAVFTQVQNDGSVRFIYRNPPASAGGVDIDTGLTVVDDGVFHRVVFVYDDVGNESRIYIDGVLEANGVNNLAPQSPLTKNSVIGILEPGVPNSPYDGIFDDFQTFKGVLTDDRILAEFNNQNSQVTFYSTGTVESIPTPFIEMTYQPENWFCGFWQQRIQLTINGGQVPSTQTDFPLLINDTYPDLAGKEEAELRFTGADNVQLDYEIQFFDNSDGKLIAWVKKPTVDNGDVINIYFDNPAAVDEQNSGAVWNSHQELGVFHLDNDLLDSSPNGEIGTPMTGASFTSPDFAPSQIGNGFDSGGNEYVRYASFPTLGDGTALEEFSISFWFEGSAPQSAARMQPAPADPFLATSQVSSGNKHVLSWDGGLAGLDDGIIKTGGVQNLVVLNWKRNTTNGFQSFRNGVVVEERDSTDNAIPDLTSSFGLQLGANRNGTENMNGILGHVTVQNERKSQDTITTEFNNQFAPGTFYSTGAVESIPAGITMGYEV